MMLSSKSGRLALGGTPGPLGEKDATNVDAGAVVSRREMGVLRPRSRRRRRRERRERRRRQRGERAARSRMVEAVHSKKTRAESLVESVDVIRDLFQRNKRDIGRVEDVTRTKLPEKKLLMLESTTRKSTGSSNDTSTNNRFREDKEGDLHRKEERRRRFAKAEREEYSRRGWKKLVRTKVGGDGLFGKGRGKETPNTLTWESLKRVRKLWREYAEGVGGEKEGTEEKRFFLVEENDDARRTRGRDIGARQKRKRRVGTFRRGRFSHETPKSKLGRRIRRGYSRDQDERTP